MNRKIVAKLQEWYEYRRKKPLVISGARGVGKTYLMYDFAKENFASNLYFNFEHDLKIYDLFSSDCNKTLQNISAYYETSIDFSQTLLILDEFALSDNAIDFVLNVFDSNQNISVICAITDSNLIDKVYENRLTRKMIERSSLLENIHLYPFDFEEFLIATNNDWYAEAIREHYLSNKPLPDIVHNNLLNIFNTYIYIGGMPSVINEYLLTNSLINITEKHSLLNYGNLIDLKSKISEGNFVKSISVYNTIVQQLMRQNKKFQYSLIRKGATKKIYEDNIDYLCATGYTQKCCHLDSEDDSFKLYMCDVGILYSMSKNIYNDEFTKSLVENYVFQNLIANENEVFFWESKSQAKIDFVAGKNNKFFALEVKNGLETRSKNYSVFKEAVKDNEGLIKISAKNFSFSKGVKFIPLYAVFCI